MAVKKRLGDSLVELGVISEDQLVVALREQKLRKKRLGQVLVELGFANEQQMLEVLSEQLGVPLVSLNEYEIDPQVLNLVPGGIAKQHALMPLFLDGNRLTVVMADPLDVFAIDQIQYKTNCKLDIVIAPHEEIMGAIKQYYGASAEMSDLAANLSSLKSEDLATHEGVQTHENIEEQSPVIKFADMVLKEAANEGASDIHIEPDEGVLRVRYRVDGVLRHILDIPQNIQSAVISRLKIMGNMDIAEKRLPQDGRIELKSQNKELDIRVNTLPTVWGEKIVMRLLDKSSVMIGLEKLGMLPQQLEKFMQVIREPNGIILLTGPTGSGKTSTLYGALNMIKSPQINITTVENPVEYKIKTLNQVQIHAEIGMTFASALRAILRQDPDVIMVGEIRDAETAEIAIESALTGHLVFSTLHTNDAPGAVTRLVEMGIEPYLLTPTILLVVAQRLMRTICDKCRIQHQPDAVVLGDLGLPQDEQAYYMGEGCVSCNKTGYKGRTGIQEMFTLNDEIKKLILNKSSDHELKYAAMESGMMNLRQAAIIKAKMGLTTLAEVMRITRES